MREEDQQRINTFNKLNTRLHELQAGVKLKKVRDSENAQLAAIMESMPFNCSSAANSVATHNLQDELEDLGDASNELMLLDEDQVPQLLVTAHICSSSPALQYVMGAGAFCCR